MKKLGIVIAIVLIGLVAVGDGNFNTCSAADTIKIGIVLPLTGRHSPFGHHIKRAFDLALEEINAAGGAKGKKLEFIYGDDQSKPETGLTAAGKIIEDDDVIMLTGEYSSSCTYPIAGLAQKKKIPFMVSTAAADKITQSGWTYIFRMDQPASEFDSGLQDLFQALSLRLVI